MEFTCEVSQQSTHWVYYLDIFSFAVSIIVGILQCQSLKIDPDLTNIVIDGGYEEAADGGEGSSCGIDEVCPVLARGGVAGLCEAAADSEPLGAVSVSISAFRRTLIGGKAGAWNFSKSIRTVSSSAEKHL